MTKPRVAKLAIPSDVAAKRVGNILGCVIHTVLKHVVTPNLARATDKGKIQPGF